jgi:UDP-3-O-[3-hydroxymyristoyl] glucosamine N-acyltransferase
MTHGRASKGDRNSRFTLADLAERLSGKPEGDGGKTFSGAAGLAEAGPEDITYISASKYLKEIASSRAGAVIAPEKMSLPGKDVIRVPNPQLAFARALEIFNPPRRTVPGVHPSAIIEEGAAVDPAARVEALCHIGRGTSVGPRSVLRTHCIVGEGSTIGSDVLLHPRVTVGESVSIGDRVIVHSGAVIGSDGFGYVRDGKKHHKIPQVGRVVISEDAEIGANVTIDRATTGTTRIGPGTKIDNLVQIAHNVEVGSNSIIVSQVGISGSTRIGSGVVLGGQVGIVGHVVVGDGAAVGAQSGVMSDVPAGETRSGIGPLPHRQWLKAQAAFDKLPDFRKRLKRLEKKIAELEEHLPSDRGTSSRKESS